MFSFTAFLPINVPFSSGVINQKARKQKDRKPEVMELQVLDITRRELHREHQF